MKVGKTLAKIVVCFAVVCFTLSCSKKDKTQKESAELSHVGQMPLIGHTVIFNPNKVINGGKKMEIEYWTWTDSDPAVSMIEKYETFRKNVKVKVVYHPWEDYWTKLPLSLKGKKGPAVFGIHNSKHYLLKPYMASYAINLDELKADFNAVDAHVIDGKVYYIDSVMMSGGIWYNKKLWKAAGLTDSDIPETWDEFRAIAKKLTKFENGKLVQAGFNWNGETYSAIYQGLNYQKGQLLFDKNNKVIYDSAATKENMKMLIDFYEKDKIGSKDFGPDSSQSFGNEQSAMVYKWGWFSDEVAAKYPELDYGVFPTPTFTKDIPFAYDRYNGESTPGINKNQSLTQQEAAQDFVRFLLADDEFDKLSAQKRASFPTKKALKTDEEILQSEVLRSLAPRVKRLIWPGLFPDTVESSAKKAMEDVLYNGMAIDEALKNAQSRMDKDMKTAEFSRAETEYAFFGEAK